MLTTHLIIRAHVFLLVPENIEDGEFDGLVALERHPDVDGHEDPVSPPGQSHDRAGKRDHIALHARHGEKAELAPKNVHKNNF
jgi:hypothetical protein